MFCRISVSGEVNKMNRSTALKPYSTLFFYLVGFAVGYAVLFLDYQISSPEPRQREFVRSWQSQIWFLSVFMQTIFWFAALVPLYRIKKFRRKELPRRRTGSLESQAADNKRRKQEDGRFWFVLAAVLFMLVFIFLRFSASFSPNCGDYGFLHSTWKTTILAWIGFVIAGLMAVELLRIGVELAKIYEVGASEKGCVEAFTILRHHSLRLLNILGVMMTLAVLSMAAKRYTITHLTNCEFRIQHIFLYALFLSMLLAFGFFPTYAALLRTGHKLVRELLPMPSPADENWLSWYERKKSLEELLQLSLPENLRAAMAILSPIAGGVISWLSSRS
jgi:hypothetical protein